MLQALGRAVAPHFLMVLIELRHVLLRTEREEHMPVRQRLDIMTVLIRFGPQHFARGPFHGDDFAGGAVIGNQDVPLRNLLLQLLIEVRERALFGLLFIGAFESVTCARNGFQFRRYARVEQAFE